MGGAGNTEKVFMAIMAHNIVQTFKREVRVSLYIPPPPSPFSASHTYMCVARLNLLRKACKYFKTRIPLISDTLLT